MKYFLYILFFLGYIIKLSGQDENELKEIFFTAEDHFYFQEYKQAYPLYLKLIKFYSENANYKYKAGTSLLFLKEDLNKSKQFLIEASKNINEYYVEGYFKEASAPSDVFFYLGMVFHITNKLDSAIYYYKKFRKTLDVYDLENIDYVKHLIKVCENAKELIEKPVSFEKFTIPVTKSSEKNFSYLIISGDQSTIVYCYINDTITEIYFTKSSIDDDLHKITNLSNKEIKIFPTSLSYDGNELYLSATEKFDNDIYISKFEDNQWTDKEKLGKNINTKFDETHACISADNQILYFTSNRKKGYGGLDIYFSTKNEKGEWDKAINMGDAINSLYNEECPFINNEGNLLLFSSEGHYNMGGFDIFYSEKDNKGKWSEPTNIGYPINTTDDNLYYFPGFDKDEAYYSIEKQLVKIKILKEKIIHTINVNGYVTLQDENYENTQIKVTLNDSTLIAKLNITPKVTNGNFTFNLNPGRYELLAEANGYQPVTKIIDIPDNFQQDNYNLSIELIPETVASGKYLAIKNIFFNFDSYFLTMDSKIELERISGFLLRNPSSSVNVSGYTDSEGIDRYNLKLSERRANSVYEYLRNNGIDKERMTFKGYGEKNAIALNQNPDGTDNPIGRGFNRRVEMQIKNTDPNVNIEDNLFIPEYLRVREKEIFTILISENINLFDSSIIKKTGIDPNQIERYRTYKGTIYTIGNYENKGNAIPLLNKIIENGYTGAKIISIYEINNLFKEKSDKAFQIFEPVYTIQIIAIKKPVKNDYFKGLEDIQLSKGDDNYYRYTYGEYNKYSDAKHALTKVQNLGFPCAFINKIENIPNYYDSY